MSALDQISQPLTKRDFESDQEIRWCPGCGDNSILAQVQRLLAELSTEKEKYVFVSGIGCSSRFPYYMNTFGFHGIHGRASAIATGVKIANPDLQVWVVTGDGDALAIGGNHFIHTIRRNIDIKILLFNNQIYGLTKGQYSPTSKVGQVTKTSPWGVVEYPFNPIAVALGAGASFVARSTDRDPKGLQDVLHAAAAHKGTAFVEIFQNCVIFNDGAFNDLSNKETKSDRTMMLEDGKPLIFGKNQDKGIRLDGFTPVVVDLKNGQHSVNDLLVHNVKSKDPVLAFIYAQMSENPNLPTPLGVFRSVEWTTYEKDIERQITTAQNKRGKKDLQDLLNTGDTWTVE
jgi:2-oxoglutarate/2-oxoacid ferredoxin oxidoreductase subunit beta